MNRILASTLAAALVCLAAPAAMADDMSNMGGMDMSGAKQAQSQPAADQAAPQKEAKSLQGEVIDSWCYFQEGAHGQAHKACATACARRGAPVALLDDQGNVFVLSDSQPHTGATRFIKYMADRVEAKGTLVTKGGVPMFYVESMKNLGPAK